MQLTLQWLQSIPSEAAFWGIGLVGVASMDPSSGVGVNLCLLENLGLFCPGDGLGRAIAHLARGQFAASWSTHPLAGPTVLILLYHISMLCQQGKRGGPSAGK